MLDDGKRVVLFEAVGIAGWSQFHVKRPITERDPGDLARVVAVKGR